MTSARTGTSGRRAPASLARAVAFPFAGLASLASLAPLAARPSFAVGLALGAALTAGCRASSAQPSVVAPVDVVIESIDAGPGSLADASAEADAQAPRCTVTLVVETVRTLPGCRLDEQVTSGPGELTFPCRGDGAAEASFEEHIFKGTLTGGALSLMLTTNIDWDDGCQWTSTQSLTGNLDQAVLAAPRAPSREASTSSQFTWTYTEAPSSGTDCAVACRASAHLHLVSPEGESDERR